MTQRQTKVGAWDYVWGTNLQTLDARLFGQDATQTEDEIAFCRAIDTLVYSDLTVEQIYAIGQALELALRLGGPKEDA